MAVPDDNTIALFFLVLVNYLASVTGETVSACFNDAQKSLLIECGTGHMLRITKAFYGYSENGKCSYSPWDCTQGEHEAYPCTGRDRCSINLPSGSFGKKLTNCDKYSTYFQVEYSCEKVIETQNICQNGDSITSQRGFISTPRYPNKYPNNEDCLARIVVDPSQYINLTIIDMDLEINGTFGCHDWMYAYNAYRSVTLCGRRTNEKLTTLQSNEISIRFQSDKKVNKKGFWVYYEAYPPLPETKPPTPTTRSNINTESPTSRSTIKPSMLVTEKPSRSTNKKESKEQKLPFVAIVAGVIGSLTFILIVLLILLVYRWWHDKQSYRHKAQHVEYLDARNPAFRSSTVTEFQGIEIYYNC